MDFTTNLLIQLKASDVTGVASGSPITGSVTPTVGPALTAVIAGSEPLYVANQFLGQPAIHFGTSGTGYGRAFATTAIASSAGSYTFAIVLSADYGSPTGAIADIASDRLLLDIGISAPAFGYYAGAFLAGGSGLADASPHVLIYVFDAVAGTGTIYFDGTQVFQGVYAAKNINSGSAVVIGASSDANPGSSPVQFAEYRLYDAALTPTQVSGVTGVLANSYVVSTPMATALSVSVPPMSIVGGSVAVTVSTTGLLASTASVTLSDGGAGGVFASNPVTLAAGTNSSVTVGYTPVAVGSVTLTATSSGLSSGSAAARVLPTQQSIACNDARVYFSPQNWYANGSTYAQTWCSNAYFKTIFTGTSFSVGVDTSILTTAALFLPTLRVWVDGNVLPDVVVASAATTVLASGLAAGTHSILVRTVRFQQAGDRWSGTANDLRITSFQIDAGGTLSAPSVLSDCMFYGGDSITEGALVDVNDATYSGTDGPKTFAALLANQLGMETCQVGNGSQVFNGGPTQDVPCFVSSWEYIQSGVPRDLAGFKLIFENLGANAGITPSDLTTWMEAVRAAYPSIGIVVVMPFDGQRNSNRTNVTAGFNAYQAAYPSDRHIFLLDGGTAWDNVHTNSTYSYDGLHYTAAGHQDLLSIAQPQIAAMASALLTSLTLSGTATANVPSTLTLTATGLMLTGNLSDYSTNNGTLSGVVANSNGSSAVLSVTPASAGSLTLATQGVTSNGVTAVRTPPLIAAIATQVNTSSGSLARHGTQIVGSKVLFRKSSQ